MKQKKKLIYVKISAILFLFIGLIGWFIPFFGRPFRSWTELPNAEPKGIALDNKGNIYCGSKFYERVQAYTPDGKFIRGFSTALRRGRGSIFRFSISDANELHIHIYDALLTDIGMVDHLIIYDLEGNLISDEKFPSKGIPYSYKRNWKNRTRDSSGNLYILKGSLFPRVVKQTPTGDKSTIISTPIWLWFFQAPFPAFAFFFISMFIIIFLRFKAGAAELSVPTTNLILNTEKLPSRRKIAIFAVGIIGITVFLCIIIPIGIKTYPFLVIFGFLSFAITIAIIILMAFICLIISTFRCIKVDSGLWKKSFSSSLKTRYEASRSLKLLADRDPVLRKTGKISNKIGLWCFFTWLILFVLAVCVVLFLDYISIWKNLID